MLPLLGKGKESCSQKRKGIVTDVNPLQYSNALTPISFTLLGIVTDVSPLQPANA